jgi:hypothetical protein
MASKFCEISASDEYAKKQIAETLLHLRCSELGMVASTPSQLSLSTPLSEILLVYRTV